MVGMCFFMIFSINKINHPAPKGLYFFEIISLNLGLKNYHIRYSSASTISCFVPSIVFEYLMGELENM